jgi:hypothetical protein
MKNSFIFLVSVFSLLLLLVQLSFADPAPFMSVGTGSFSCGRWDQAWIDNPTQIELETQWVAGFVVGSESVYNRYTDKPIRIKTKDLDGIKFWVNNFCKKHPTKSIAWASGIFTLTHLYQK